ncbi:hypothetical protein D5S18_29730 [Nocardia panacis]|uniref:DUF3159 domain-containing protein n=1 Tax=Nocardia panacis TaxID=2340916 RepID=A0A3A4KL78_9NOCA|nr:hypothetical protein [Nocardia panacis]RJO70039.1 hypothetical protein D5S18_29730 [Nocardia panacis]
MSYLRTFAPWVVYALVPDRFWQWGALAALVLSLVEIARRTRAGHRLDALILDAGTALFFVALTVLAFAVPNSPLHAYGAAASNGVLALIAGVSIAVRVPFTLGIAKQTTPREIWDHPIFLRMNYLITAVWTASFALGALALVLLAHSGAALRIPTQVAAFAIPMIFTIRYVAHMQAKGRAAGHAL